MFKLSMLNILCCLLCTLGHLMNSLLSVIMYSLLVANSFSYNSFWNISKLLSKSLHSNWSIRCWWKGQHLVILLTVLLFVCSVKRIISMIITACFIFRFIIVTTSLFSVKIMKKAKTGRYILANVWDCPKRTFHFDDFKLFFFSCYLGPSLNTKLSNTESFL